MSSQQTRTRPPSAGDQTPDAIEINAQLAKLRIVKNSVDNKSWVSADLLGEPVASIGSLNSSGTPLSALDSAGMGFLTPMVSFLNEPLDQVRGGNPDAVASGASDFDGAGRDGTAVATEYKSTAASDTSQWSGQASSDYLSKGVELADGILGIAETALTSAKALIGAGEVVAQVVEAVTGLIGEAVGKIMPIMSQAIAAAPATFGQSIAEAIPQCVEIAVEYAGKIAGKLAALLSSGENLIKLADGAAAGVKIIRQGLSVIGKQATSGSPAQSSTKPSGTPPTDKSKTGSTSPSPAPG